MEKLKEFKSLLQKKAKDQVPIQTEWVAVKSVNWEEKTMVGTGLENGLDYEDVLLGLGSFYRKPKVGTMAIIGTINNSAAAFMIDCEETEELAWKNEESEYRITPEGFEVKKGNESLKKILNDFIDEVNKIVVIQGTTINQVAVEEIKQRLNTVLI